MVGEADSDPLEVVSPSTSIVHSREKVQLCYEIVLDNFGGLAAVSRSRCSQLFLG